MARKEEHRTPRAEKSEGEKRDEQEEEERQKRRTKKIQRRKINEKEEHVAKQASKHAMSTTQEEIKEAGN